MENTARYEKIITMVQNIKTDLKWYAESTSRVITALDSDPKTGLSQEEHERRLKIFGYNKLEQKKRFRFLKLLWSQLKSPLIFILIIAGVITLFLQVYTDAIVIFIAVAINTFIGVFHEGRASQAFEKLKDAVKKYAVVIRDGKKKKIEAALLVPGDIVLLQGGDQVPADLRIIESRGLSVNEAILTGEWLPVGKNEQVIKGHQRITDQKNMVWMGTVVEDGVAKGIVVSTGMKTEFGHIAELLKGDQRLTPFQKGIKRLAQLIGFVVLAVILLIFILGLLKGQSLLDMFLVTVALAVAAIPEGLPVAVTVILALSMSRILKKGGLVKRLPDAETLGAATVILTDKTGTLTQAIMQIKKAIPINALLKDTEDKIIDKEIVKMALLSGTAFIENPEERREKWRINGDPTEKALITSAPLDIHPEKILETMPRLDVIPFDSARRFSASLNTYRGENFLFAKGAPETILSFSQNLNEKEKKKIKQKADLLAKKGMRVLGISFKKTQQKELVHKDPIETLSGTEFAGLIALHDPVRADVPEAIRQTMEAGIRLLIVTGDKPETALYVAEEIGLKAKRAIIGEEIEKMTDVELKEILRGESVFARILPQEKKRMARILEKDGEVVAMTGDGVNDAPALAQADIGIALNSGTDVAKEAGNLVLIDDSFRVIVSAIREGRIVIDNLRKVVTYLLATNFSEVILIAGALLLGFALPVLPAQILWANIVGEGLMNFAFAFEPGEHDVMRRGPERGRAGRLITGEMKTLIFGIGIITALLLVVLLVILSSAGYSIEHIRTILFAGLVMDSLFFIFALKSLRQPIWKINIFSNTYLLVAFSANVLLLAAALTLPPLQKLLHTITPNLLDVGIILGLGIVNLILIEGAKWYFIVKKKV